MNVLVIAAHPDDEVLGCGGTMAKLAREGHDLYVAILGEGITSRYGERDQADPSEVETLRQGCRDATGLLKAKEVFFDSLPDNRFDTVPLLDIVKRIESRIDDLRPAAVYTHHGGDLNVDHAVVFRATLTATRPQPGSPVRAVYAYEVPSATDWALQQFVSAFRPNVFVEIADTLETKLRAVEMYRTEVRPFPHPRSPQALRAAAERWGSIAGVRAAEAFEVVRELR